MPLLHQSDLQRRPAVGGSEGEISNDPRSIDSTSQDQYIERRFSEMLDLLGAGIRHSVTSLEDAVLKTYRA